MLLIQPKSILKRIYPKAICYYNRTEKSLYLTFDDGPIPTLTQWVLEELLKYNAKATFFCVGANILKNPEIFNNIKTAGHTVANHTMHHIKGFKTNVAEYMKEVDDCKTLIGNNLFRPPYGQLKRSQYRALTEKKYKVILWDVISYDYENISPENCGENAIRNSKNGSIVLFHDNLKADKNIRYALPVFLKHFSDLNYQFKAIEI